MTNQRHLMSHQETTQQILRHYDELGDREWQRLNSDVQGRVSLEIHRQFLRRHVPAGARVLEIGAGPGRFTTELASLGCRLVVTDLSPVQLAAHEARIANTPAESCVELREMLDICDTSRYADGEFDAVVAFGGPLSYAFDHATDALRGLFRITKTTGVVVASVMSLLGTWRHLFSAVTGLAETMGEDANDAVLQTGDLRHVQPEGHVCRMFRWSDVEQLVAQADGVLADGCASNWASLADEEALARIEADPDRWQRFLQHELAACSQPGARDGGTHILFAATPRA